MKKIIFIALLLLSFSSKELRAYATEELGEEFDIREFHDEVLGRGSVPLSVLDANIRAWVGTKKAE